MENFDTGNVNFNAVANKVLSILIAEMNEDDFHYEQNIKNATDRVNNAWVDGDTVKTLLAKCQ